MANKQRGEVTLELCDKEYILRPTFEALCELEDRSGESIIKLFDSIQSGVIRLRELSLITWAGIYGGNPETDLTQEDVGNMIMDEGLVKFLEKKGKNEGDINPVTQFMLNSILGGEDPEAGKKQKETPKKTKKTE